ncbi:uncharacterized protein TNCV_2193311 [Trichonephila clavipes]|nr:uncharacterized protein TNCV_2193311 [Trichonephila clavipes]
MSIEQIKITSPQNDYYRLDGSSRHLRIEPPGDFYAFFTGDSFFITCIPDPGSGATRLTWQTPNKRDITHTRGRVHVEPSAHNILGLELVVEEVRYKDQGVFTCSAVVDGRETTIKFTLKVYLAIGLTWEHDILVLKPSPCLHNGNETDDWMGLDEFYRAFFILYVLMYVPSPLSLEGPIVNAKSFGELDRPEKIESRKRRSVKVIYMDL